MKGGTLLNHYSDFFGHVGKRLDKKAELNFNLRCHKIITIHLLPNISNDKENQTTKFSQLIEYNRNIFLEKSHINCSGETSPRLF